METLTASFRRKRSRLVRGAAVDRLLTVKETAEMLGTTDRFPRRLIAERRIEFVKVGRHVRIPLRAIEVLVSENTITPREMSWVAGKVRP